MSLHLLLWLHSLLLHRPGSRLSSFVEKDLECERDTDEDTRRKKKEDREVATVAKPVSYSLSLYLRLSIPSSLLFLVTLSLPTLFFSLFLFSLPLSLISVSRWIRTSRAANAVDVGETDGVYE